ncbi:MAG TPA: hypothetical protein VN660_07770 [Steroidobacteraceae bacterium]|nr:hypothetical protein [Steroidobacteraceae bacterium]
MNIVSFPGALPAPHQLDLPRLRLIELTNSLAAELLGHCNELMKASNAPEFAAVVRKTADHLAEASAGWAAMSSTIRDCWRI